MKLKAAQRMAVAAVLVGAGLFFFSQKKGGAGGAEQQMKPAKVERGELEITISSTGIVQPQNRLEIKPPIAGRVEEVFVREGEEVKRGQVMAWLSSTERAALLDAARAQGEESLARWEQVYKPTPLLAPLDGTLIRRAVEPGQTVTAADAVFILSDRLIIKAQVDETDVGQVKLKQPAVIALDAYPGQEIAASVDHIAYEAQTVNNVTIYEVDVLPESVPETMRSGMTASVTFVVERKEGALLVPAMAVEREGGKPAVLAGPQVGRASRREVETGLTDGRVVEVLSGLDEGETVWLKSAQGLPARKEQWSPFAPSRPGGGRPRQREN